MDQNQSRRGGHFHRGRRGPDRRGLDRRTPPPAPPRDQVDVEQIMRDIRSRIAQRQGIELSNQQIQDLAARKLESILDPRAIKPSLLDGIRRSMGAEAPTAVAKASSEPVYSFEDTTIYDSHRGLLRFMRRLLNPLLKLFFNPNPLIRALHLQARLNVEAAEREAERERRQMEWNALHYEIVQRLVTEVSRLSLEAQALSARVESLNGRVDFTDRRVRGLEGAAHVVRGPVRPAEIQPRPAPALTETPAATPPPPDGGTPPVEIGGQMAVAPADGARRRRRRRRGRRSNIMQTDGGQMGARPAPPPPPHADSEPLDSSESEPSDSSESAPLPAPVDTAVVASSPEPEVPSAPPHLEEAGGPPPTTEPTDPERSE